MFMTIVIISVGFPNIFNVSMASIPTFDVAPISSLKWSVYGNIMTIIRQRLENCTHKIPMTPSGNIFYRENLSITQLNIYSHSNQYNNANIYIYYKKQLILNIFHIFIYFLYLLIIKYKKITHKLKTLNYNFTLIIISTYYFKKVYQIEFFSKTNIEKVSCCCKFSSRNYKKFLIKQNMFSIHNEKKLIYIIKIKIKITKYAKTCH
ncbi:hypothetical protein AGLY_002814 [Aphis glycines]|uniref:Uncharacterized protein n=1 Tax=Aphis glycines TaxID=307491 RepID=A0A6G0U1T8_APHGL|nr:hypothetical protein AGLY_002814 [Aphis glycines]